MIVTIQFLFFRRYGRLREGAVRYGVHSFGERGTTFRFLSLRNVRESNPAFKAAVEDAVLASYFFMIPYAVCGPSYGLRKQQLQLAFIPSIVSRSNVNLSKLQVIPKMKRRFS